MWLGKFLDLEEDIKMVHEEYYNRHDDTNSEPMKGLKMIRERF